MALPITLKPSHQPVRAYYLALAQLCEILARFFDYRESVNVDWERAVEEFRARVPELGKSVQELIHRARAGAVHASFVYEDPLKDAP